MEDNNNSDSKYKDALSRLNEIKQALKNAKDITNVAELINEFKSLYSNIPHHLLAEAGLDIEQITKSANETIRNIKDQLTITHSQEEIARIKLEAEAKELEYAISHSMSKIDDYYKSKDTLERYHKYADIVARGKDATAEEIEHSVSLYKDNRDNEAKNLEEFEKAKREKQKLEERLAKLDKNSEEYKNISETLEKIDEHLSKAEKPIVNSLDNRIEFLKSPVIKDEVVAKTEDGKDIRGSEEAELLQAQLSEVMGFKEIADRSVKNKLTSVSGNNERREDKGKVSEEKDERELKVNQDISHSSGIASSPVSNAGNEKLVISLTNNTQTEMGPSIKPTATPTPPIGIKNRNKPITK
jgi:hypothetical protein